ncbi:glycosyltransferase family 2 protein [Paenibacillus sp. P26]|nr:glycosyltransferase family 2 protein [Paenibacillus sp. P26]
MTDTMLSIIIPARNEAERSPRTMQAILSVRHDWERASGGRLEIIVVDDGDQDATAQIAAAEADLVIKLSNHSGKGAAMRTGWKAASAEMIVFLDADLEGSARHWPRLLEPLVRGEADLIVAQLPPARRKGGLGLVKTMASHGVLWLSGYTAKAPLSGQRAVRKEVLRRGGRWFEGFGVEVGMLIDAVKMGYRVRELELPFHHRETGRRWKDWVHRGKQLMAVGRTLWLCWRKPVC